MPKSKKKKEERLRFRVWLGFWWDSLIPIKWRRLTEILPEETD